MTPHHTILTVLFDAPYWIALLEQFDDSTLRVARHVFGAEPSDAQVYAFIQHDYAALLDRLSPALPLAQPPSQHINPKRQQRLVRAQMAARGIATKSQDALRLQLEAHKQDKAIRTKQQRDRLKAYKRGVRSRNVSANAGDISRIIFILLPQATAYNEHVRSSQCPLKN